jgi:hypothetical protein
MIQVWEHFQPQKSECSGKYETSGPNESSVRALMCKGPAPGRATAAALNAGTRDRGKCRAGGRRPGRVGGRAALSSRSASPVVAGVYSRRAGFCGPSRGCSNLRKKIMPDKKTNSKKDADSKDVAKEPEGKPSTGTSEKMKLPPETLEVSTLDFRRRVLLSYPPTALALLSKSRCLVGGGGGSAKTGIPNRVCTFDALRILIFRGGLQNL